MLAFGVQVLVLGSYISTLDSVFPTGSCVSFSPPMAYSFPSNVAASPSPLLGVFIGATLLQVTVAVDELLTAAMAARSGPAVAVLLRKSAVSSKAGTIKSRE